MVRSLIFAVASLVASPLFAVNCSGTICNTRSNYVAPSYVAPVATNYAHDYVATSYPQTVVQTQNVFYEVGGAAAQYPAVPNANIAAAEYAQVAREMQRLQDRLADLKPQQPAQQAQPPINVYLQLPAGATVPAQPATQPAMPQQPQQPAQSQPFSMTQKPNGILQSRCVKCHSGANAKGSLDLTSALTCEQKLDAMRKVINGDMPKGGPPLTPEELGDFWHEMLETKTQAGPAVQAVISPTNAKQLAGIADVIEEMKAKR